MADAIHDVAYNDIVRRDRDSDRQGRRFTEFVVLNSVLDQGLHGYRRDKKIFSRKVGDLDDHADGFGETDLQQIEIVADKINLLAQDHEVPFPVAQDIPVDEGERVIIPAGALGVPRDQEGQGVEGVKDEMRVDLVFQRLQFGLGFGDIQLLHPGFVLFLLAVEKQDLVNIGDETGSDYDHQNCIDERAILVARLPGPEP